MTKEKRIKLNVFLCDIHIIITDDPNKCVDDKRIRPYCQDSPDGDLSKNCDGFVFQKGKSDYFVMLSPNATCNVISHESVHVAGRIFNDRGQTADYGNDEIFAYYVGWIAGEISDYLSRVYNSFDGAAQ
jgi:hypothetical protein